MLTPTFEREQALHQQGYRYIAGVDEVGRGAWAGPIVGAAVILPVEKIKFKKPLRDSKKLTAKQRDYFYEIIVENCLSYQISIVDHREIDQSGINQANKKVLQQSALQLNPRPDYLLIDNIKMPFQLPIPFQLIPQGDAIVSSIAAASILAKVTRDRIMKELAHSYPLYGFTQHKGYGTQLHQERINQYGICSIHRKSYQPIKTILNL